MILDLFAGAGGWDEGARLAGYVGPMVGLELDHAACQTAVAAGHPRVRCDVAAFPTHPFAGKVDGLIASPPCQSFSGAGNRRGFDDPRGLLSHEPLRWARALRPRWVALEQVPEVLPHWRSVAHALRGEGYSAWCGVLNSADFGVPQTRRRAILIARRDGLAARAPEATHSASGGGDDLFGGMPRWVSMASALGWEGAALKRDRGTGLVERHGDREPRPMDEPAYTVTCGEGGTGTRMSWVMYAAGQTSGESAGVVPREPSEPSATITGKGTAAWVHTRPATTVCADPRIGHPGHPGHPGHRDRAGGEAQFAHDSVRVAVQEAAILQSYRADYPWQGTKTQTYAQIGNSIPPVLAAAIIRPLLAASETEAAA